jgi:succinate dehydrogenase/fumarate reductase flavoprotein subunit
MPRITWASVPVGFDALVAAAGLAGGACAAAMTDKNASVKITEKILMLVVS